MKQVAIISGGLGDIGQAIARELAQRGADVAVGDVLPDDQGAALIAKLRSLGRRVRYDRVDVADPKAVQAWVGDVSRDLGPANLIVPNAAIVSVQDLAALNWTEWSRTLRINLDGAYHLAAAAARILIDLRMPGRIVFIGSWAGHRPHPGLGAYCVAKAGLRMLCKCMALELAGHGILVNEVAPGYVDAGLSGRIFEKEPAIRQKAQRRVPIGELITPAQVALEVAHLCDPAVRHSTGSVMLMDGGLSLLSGNEGK